MSTEGSETTVVPDTRGDLQATNTAESAFNNFTNTIKSTAPSGQRKAG
jgi:hypothetical protein